MNGIYARQSVDKKDSISIETQIDFCKKVIGNEQYKVYADKGYSGKNIKRPHFQELLQDVKDGIVSKVIIYKLDRMSRSLLDFANLIEFFKKYNVSFQSTQEHFDTSTPMGNAMLSITMVFAQLERETIQQRIKDNYYARGKKGFFLGGTVPFGFDKISTLVEGKKASTFEENTSCSKVVKLIFEMYSDKGMSLNSIARTLNLGNILSPNQSIWDSSKINRLLRNPIYVESDSDIYSYYKERGCTCTNDISDFTSGNGCYLYGKRESNERKYTNIEGHILSLGLHKGFIPSTQFLRAQRRLDDNTQVKNTGKGKYTWLSGLVKCGYCLTSMAVATGKTKDGVIKYFVCRGRPLGICQLDYKLGRKKGIRVEEIEEIVKNRIFTMAELKKKLFYEHISVNDKKENEIKIKVVKIEDQINKLLEVLISGTEITAKYINDKISVLDSEKKQLIKCMEDGQKASPKIEQIKQFYDIIEEWEGLYFDQKKEITFRLIDKILITQDEITIEWKYSFAEQGIVDIPYNLVANE